MYRLKVTSTENNSSGNGLKRISSAYNVILDPADQIHSLCKSGTVAVPRLIPVIHPIRITEVVSEDAPSTTTCNCSLS